MLRKIIRKEKKTYDTIVFVSHKGARGIGYIETICYANKYYRYSFIWAYGPNECNLYNPPRPIKCTTSNRILLTAQVSSNEYKLQKMKYSYIYRIIFAFLDDTNFLSKFFRRFHTRLVITWVCGMTFSQRKEIGIFIASMVKNPNHVED